MKLAAIKKDQKQIVKQNKNEELSQAREQLPSDKQKTLDYLAQKLGLAKLSHFTGYQLSGIQEKHYLSW